MNYITKLAQEIYQEINPKLTMTFEEAKLYHLYALLCLVKGIRTTSEDVHNAWCLWTIEYDPNSRLLIPYSELSISIKDRYLFCTLGIMAVAKRRQIR